MLRAHRRACGRTCNCMSSTIAIADSRKQVLGNVEYFAPLDRRHEIIFLRQRDCMGLGSVMPTEEAAATRPARPRHGRSASRHFGMGSSPEVKVRCGRPPKLRPCSAEALSRLSTCRGPRDTMSLRSRTLGLHLHGPGCARAPCYSRVERAAWLRHWWCPRVLV